MTDMEETVPGFPRFCPPVFTSQQGELYLKEPGVALIAKTQAAVENARPFVEGFGLFDADDYFDDVVSEDALEGGEEVAKFAGQLCYLSFGQARSRNAEAGKYLDNIKKQAHGSVLEHANYSFLFWGIDRAVTHEIVRHRAGFGFSQVSQRYVSGRMLRFVMRPEYQNNLELEQMFLSWTHQAHEQYDIRAQLLGDVINTAGMNKTEARKAVNQSARACLPNEAEAPIVVTANGRGWRHFLEMRASEHADATIRELAYRVHEVLSHETVAPMIFSDYEPDSIKRCVSTPWRKV